MVDIRIRQAEGCSGDPYLVPDTVWLTDGQTQEQGGDWRLADPADAENAGGLQAKSGIISAVILALFTDKRCPDNHPLRYLADGDPRGWWGDMIDVDTSASQGELGSLLWLFQRAPATEDIRRWVEAIAADALEPLTRQQAVARIACSAVLNEIRGRIELEVALYGRDGTTVFQQRFAQLWGQLS
jgi:phage gp46-like protein